MSGLRHVEVSAAPVTIAGRPGQVAGTLVLLHAFPLNARMWEPQFEMASAGWRIIAPHFRGFDGVPFAGPATIDDYAGDVVDLLDRLHVHEAVIVGLSMGGYVAFALMRRARQYVRALVLADTKAPGDTAEAKRARETMIAIARERGAAAVADELLPKLLGETSRRERPDLVERVRSLIESSTPGAIESASRALMSRQDSTPLLSTIHVPVLILVGDEDILTPPPLADAMSRGIAESELVTIPRAGHLSNLEQPASFNAAVARFLADRI
jgi:pimeloyl-ACP methyl ester carboxylesterase